MSQTYWHKDARGQERMRRGDPRGDSDGEKYSQGDRSREDASWREVGPGYYHAPQQRSRRYRPQEEGRDTDNRADGGGEYDRSFRRQRQSSLGGRQSGGRDGYGYDKRWGGRDDDSQCWEDEETREQPQKRRPQRWSPRSRSRSPPPRSRRDDDDYRRSGRSREEHLPSWMDAPRSYSEYGRRRTATTSEVEADTNRRSDAVNIAVGGLLGPEGFPAPKPEDLLPFANRSRQPPPPLPPRGGTRYRGERGSRFQGLLPLGDEAATGEDWSRYEMWLDERTNMRKSRQLPPRLIFADSDVEENFWPPPELIDDDKEQQEEPQKEAKLKKEEQRQGTTAVDDGPAGERKDDDGERGRKASLGASSAEDYSKEVRSRRRATATKWQHEVDESRLRDFNLADYGIEASKLEGVLKKDGGQRDRKRRRRRSRDYGGSDGNESSSQSREDLRQHRKRRSKRRKQEIDGSSSLSDDEHARARRHPLDRHRQHSHRRHHPLSLSKKRSEHNDESDDERRRRHRSRNKKHTSSTHRHRSRKESVSSAFSASSGSGLDESLFIPIKASQPPTASSSPESDEAPSAALLALHADLQAARVSPPGSRRASVGDMPTDATKATASDEDVAGRPLSTAESKQMKPDYGAALLRGEGEAIAHYVQSGKRIPRRGEVGLTAEEIEGFETLGYVMSGSRHRRMNAVRIRKENQVITAEEQMALRQLEREEKQIKEQELIRDLQELLEETRQRTLAQQQQTAVAGEGGSGGK